MGFPYVNFLFATLCGFREPGEERASETDGDDERDAVGDELVDH